MNSSIYDEFMSMSANASQAHESDEQTEFVDELSDGEQDTDNSECLLDDLFS